MRLVRGSPSEMRSDFFLLVLDVFSSCSYDMIGVYYERFLPVSDIINVLAVYSSGQSFFVCAGGFSGRQLFVLPREVNVHFGLLGGFRFRQSTFYIACEPSCFQAVNLFVLLGMFRLQAGSRGHFLLCCNVFRRSTFFLCCFTGTFSGNQLFVLLEG